VNSTRSSWARLPPMRSSSLGVFAHHSIAPTRNRWFADSLLEGDGFELSVPRQRRHPSATANRLSRHHFREISACASHQRLRPLRGNPPSFRGKSPVPRKGPRSTPPGPAGACISENARASKRQLVPFTDIGGSRGAKGKPGRGKSPVPRKGPRSTPPGHVGACMSENAHARARPNGRVG
jgi:hypothetical protein